MKLRKPFVAVALSLVAGAGACMPYTVGHTAKPVLQHETRTTTTVFAAPHNHPLGVGGDWDYVGVDAEVRTGVSDRADVGLRLTSASGLVGTYMRRLNGRTIDAGPSISMLIGGGFINLPEHFELEATLVASAAEGGRFTPYGGLRAMKAFAMEETVQRHTPVFGGFLGTRLGSSQFGFSPEIGVFYDNTAYYNPTRHIVIVPAISVHGDPRSWLRARKGRS